VVFFLDADSWQRGRGLQSHQCAVHERRSRFPRARTTTFTFRDTATATTLKLMLNLTKPEFAIPYHGEPRHALAYADLCEESGFDRTTIPFLQVGDVLSVKPGHIDIIDQVPAGSVLVDGLTIGDVGYSVLRDRKHLNDDGVVVATVILDKKSGAILSGPDITQRGFLHAPSNAEFLARAEEKVEDKLQGLRGGMSGDEAGISRLVRETLSDVFWTQLRRRPMILPVVMEV
jgi:ribonuclease J